MATRSTSRLSALRTGCSLSSGWGALRLERSPSTSRHGSVWLHWMKLTPLLGMESTRPLPPCSIRRRTSSSTST